jgi:hypothetical protein
VPVIAIAQKNARLRIALRLHFLKVVFRFDQAACPRSIEYRFRL